MGFGHWSASSGQVVIDKPLLQGGIVAVYYLPGTLVGALWGGWLGDRYGRISAIAFATLWAMVGAALQCSAQNADWMFCARVFTGIGTGILNAVTPVWATETASHTSRGAFVSMEFTLNIFGVVVAYWLEYGTSFYGDGTSGFIWRFPIAYQIVPLIGKYHELLPGSVNNSLASVLFIVIWFMPESPRWLVKVGRVEEARFILGRLRGEEAESFAEEEFKDICNIVELELKTSKQQSYVAMLFGIGQGKLHTARRVQLVVWLQILQEWIGIAGITIYGPRIFEIAGIAPKDRQWVSGLNNITYMVSSRQTIDETPANRRKFATLICVFTLDRIGRRWTLYWGAIGQGISCFCAGGLAYATQNSTGSMKSHIGGAAVFFVFLYTAIFGATWLTVPWLYPVSKIGVKFEITESDRSTGRNLSPSNPCQRLNEKTLYIFGGVNVLALVVVWALYPESNQRTLEEMNLVFACDSIWNWEAEKHFAILKEENPDLALAARRGSSVADPETGRKSSVQNYDDLKSPQRRSSLVVGESSRTVLTL
nr:sugar transporter stl1 [Quercus suber]